MQDTTIDAGEHHRLANAVRILKEVVRLLYFHPSSILALLGGFRPRLASKMDVADASESGAATWYSDSEAGQSLFPSHSTTQTPRKKRVQRESMP